MTYGRARQAAFLDDGVKRGDDMIESDAGRRIRNRRRALGMSQSDLGAGKYSGSYISHIESGRRALTPSVLTFLADRLGVSPADLGGNSDGSLDDGLRIMQFLNRARSASAEGDWALALAAASDAMRTAGDTDRLDRLWEATFIKSQALFGSGDFAGAVTLAGALAQRELPPGLTGLKAQALTLCSKALLANDEPRAAASRAQEAVDVCVASDTPELVNALIALVVALTEVSDFGAAQRAARRLEELRDGLHSQHQRGLVAWTLGVLASQTGDAEKWFEEVEAVERDLNPNVDLRQWARMHKTIAQNLIEYDRDPDRAVAHLAQARRVLQLLGHRNDLAHLAMIEAKYEAAYGDKAEAVRILRQVTESHEATDAIVGAAYSALGDVYRDLAEIDEARVAYRKAAGLLERGGSLQLAVDAWRRYATVGAEQTHP